ncbi:MAG TPA: efflux RND transporter periplasmic adaptor subunit [Reyranella sp.]|nr:efflux RND transporter periplasmic adaptor subunit [Reyranella sp.]
MSESREPSPHGRVVNRPRLIGAAALVVIALAGLWWLGLPPFSGAPPKEGRTKRAEVQQANVEVTLSDKQVSSLKIAAVGRARFDVTRSAVGSIDFNQNMLVQVFTPNQGRIIATYANVGDRVQKGQVLFTVDSPDLLTAMSNLIQAAGVLVLQNANLKRLTETLRGGGGAQKDVDQARSDQQTAEGNLRAARDTVRIFGKTEEEIDQIIRERKADSVLVVRSPITGSVTQRTAAPGLLVQPGNAPAPFTVADTSTMWMLANVVEADAPLMRVGQPIIVRVSAYGNRQFDGAITVVGAQVDPATRRFLVRSEIRDPEQLLRAGMFATFTIRIAAPVETTAVPDDAVVREGDGSMTVWVTTDRRRFVKRTIKTGMQQNGSTEILEGLQPGELVVVDGAVFVSNKAFGVAGAD